VCVCVCWRAVCPVKLADGCGSVRAIVSSTPGGATDGQLYVATTNNCVLHGSLQDKLSTVIHVSIADTPPHTHTQHLGPLVTLPA